MLRFKCALRHLADGYPGLALIAAGMERARAERLSFAYRVDRLWPTRALRLSLYVAIRLGTRLPVWAEIAAWNARRLPMLHMQLSVAYRRSVRPGPSSYSPSPQSVSHAQQSISGCGPTHRRVQRRLELLRRTGGAD